MDPARIDYVVSNHAEPDHSGALPRVMQVATGAKVVTTDPAGLKVISGHHGAGFDYMPVKAGQTLSLGRRELTFVATPMLHWPDNMVTWCPQEKILFSNDAFGQHLATSQRFDEEQDLSVVMRDPDLLRQHPAALREAGPKSQDRAELDGSSPQPRDLAWPHPES